MFNSKRLLVFCATTVAGFSTLGVVSQVAFADTPKAGDTVVTYNRAPQPAEWGLSVPSSIKLNEGLKNTGPVGHENFVAKSCKLSIIKADGSDYSDTQDRTFTINGDIANGGQFLNKKDPSQKVGLNVKIMNIGDAHEKDDVLDDYGIGGSSFKDQTIEAIYKADGSQKSERYVKFYSHLPDLDNGENWETSVSWTASEKTP